MSDNVFASYLKIDTTQTKHNFAKAWNIELVDAMKTAFDSSNFKTKQFTDFFVSDVKLKTDNGGVFIKRAVKPIHRFSVDGM